MGIMDFFANRTYKHDSEVDKDYQKRCEAKIKKLCGGITSSDSFVKRAKKYRISDSYTATYEKHILKYECKYGRLKFVDIEDRLDELLQMDTVTLLDIMANEDSSKFKTQKDIEDYVGEGYVCKLNGKLKPRPSHVIKPQTPPSTKNERIEHERKRREEQRLAKEKRDDDFRRNKQRIHLDGQARKETPSQPTKKYNLVDEFNKFKQERDEQLEKEKQEMELKRKEYQEELDRKREFDRTLRRIKNHNSLGHIPQKSARTSIPEEKSALIKRGRADIEIFTNVKSNTALASAALFLATGVLLAEAKEEMKWVKTQIEIKDDRIIIKRPYIYHKYKDFRYFKVDHEDDYYLFYIGFSNEELIHFKTKEKYLVDVIMDKIKQTGLQYEHV